MNLREPLAPDGQPKQLLSVMTRSVELARAVWPEAGPEDVGDLRIYFDWRDEAEVAAARAAFEAAQRQGVAFFRLDDEGEQITNFDEALAAAVAQRGGGAAPEPPLAQQNESSVAEPARRRGRPPGSGSTRIQGATAPSFPCRYARKAGRCRWSCCGTRPRPAPAPGKRGCRD